MMKSSILLAAVLFVASIVVGILQLWFAPWSGQNFIKIELTLAAFFVIDIVLIYVIKEYKAYKSISQADEID